jgi:hypothetical protein
MSEKCFLCSAITTFRSSHFILENNKNFLAYSIESKISHGKIVLCIYAKKSSTDCSTTRGYLSFESKSFNWDNVIFRYVLESKIARFGVTPDKIFNVDEPGFSTSGWLRTEENIGWALLRVVNEWSRQSLHHMIVMT